MKSLAFRTTKFMLDVLTKVIKADLRLHNAEAIKDDMSIIYVVNHFTRLETVLLPYVIHKATGKIPWSLASGNLFFGRLGAYLHAMGTVSTQNPDRDKIITHALLAGEHPWIIFPEGAMIKDKKMVDTKGAFKIYNKGVRRAPHKGAAFLALHTEFFREKLRCIRDNPRIGDVDQALERFGLESVEQATQKRTVIVPVNITYFPIRSRRNVLMRVAKALVKNLSERALEELSVEGTILAKGSDIDIRLGEPIEVGKFLEASEFAELMACGDDDIEKMEADPRSTFNDAARELTKESMTAIYNQTTVNFDHIFAHLIRHQKAKHFTERAYRNRIFLAAREIVEGDLCAVHGSLRRHYRDIIYEEPNEQFDDFLNLCVQEGLLALKGPAYHKNFDIQSGATDFHSIRRRELTSVIANEVEPLEAVVGSIRKASRASRKEVSRMIRQIIEEEDQRKLTVLAAVARELVAAERRSRVEGVVGVDPHRPRAQRVRHLVGLFEVTRAPPGGPF